MKSTYLPGIAAKMNKFAKLDQNEYFLYFNNQDV